MSENISIDWIKFIISRLLVNAKEASKESKEDHENLFAEGKSIAYYEMMDILQSETEARGLDLHELGLDIDLEKELL